MVGRSQSANIMHCKDKATLSGIAVETDDRTGLALRVAPVRLGGRLAEAVPAWWE